MKVGSLRLELCFRLKLGILLFHIFINISYKFHKVRGAEMRSLSILNGVQFSIHEQVLW